MSVKDKLIVDDKIIVCMVGVYSLNYNSYVSTTLVLPPMFITSYYF